MHENRLSLHACLSAEPYCDAYYIRLADIAREGREGEKKKLKDALLVSSSRYGLTGTFVILCFEISAEPSRYPPTGTHHAQEDGRSPSARYASHRYRTLMKRLPLRSVRF